MSYPRNPECPQWVWDEENNNLNTLKVGVDKKVNDLNKRIVKKSNEIRYGVGEAKYAPKEIAVSKKDMSNYSREIDEINSFIEQPYFAHVELTAEDDHMVIYLSKKEWSPEFFNEETDAIIVDIDNGGSLIEAIASNYYNNTLEEIKHNGKKYKYEVYRNITINHKELMKVFPILDRSGDDYDGSNISEVTDMFLLEMLNLRKDNREMRDIIATIQKRQYEIITQEPRKNFIVQGCAGSGKTAIMLHRMRHMKKRNKNIDWEKTIIITPSTLFKNYSAGMIREFKLDIIRQTTIEELYWEYIKQYDKYFRTTETDINAELNEYPEAFVNEILSNNMLATIAKEAISFIKFNLDIVKRHNIEYEKGANSTVKSISNNIAELILDYEKEWEEYKALKKSDEIYIEFTTKINELEKEIKHLSRQSKETSIKLADTWSTFSKEEDEVKQEKLHQTAIKLQEKISELKTKKNSVLETLQMYSDELNEYIESTYNNYIKYSKLNDIGELRSARINLERIERRTFDYVLSHSIKRCKEKYGIEGKTKFTELKSLNRTELWTLLYIYKYVNGNEPIEQLDFINIDEGQNLNIYEYKLLMSIQGNAVFNIYGDIKQKYYTNIGIDSWSDISFDSSFSLDENYRNPASIVTYSNKFDHVSMIPMGPDGAAVKVFDTCEKCFNDSDFRLSLNANMIFIVKDYSVYEDIKEEIEWYWNTDYITGNSINRDGKHINVIPLEHVIGMEFKDVVVCEKGMTDSQKYIAHTRALDSLTIIKH